MEEREKCYSFILSRIPHEITNLTLEKAIYIKCSQNLMVPVSAYAVFVFVCVATGTRFFCVRKHESAHHWSCRGVSVCMN
jgi:hypothetical protein